jgi:hypothetical protein
MIETALSKGLFVKVVKYWYEISSWWFASCKRLCIPSSPTSF